MEPLAHRMKPISLDEFVGQEHIVGQDKLLYRLIKADRLTSAIFWGPPGCGKTSLARIIAHTTNNKFEQLNATASGVGDIKRVVEEAKNIFMNPSGKVILFIDEIHRFNKLQQDALLPHVENGTVILIGATTENPYFEVNKALISRSTVFKFEPLKEKDIEKAMIICLKNKDYGLGNMNIEMSDKLIHILASLCNGDMRTALNVLELIAITTDMDKSGKIIVTEDAVYECLQKKKLQYDKDSEEHYDNISAFIKSMRGSDPNATLLYMARMLAAGEDPMFVARRIVLAASEDVGLANSDALVVANSAMQAVHNIGMPEARIILAHAATFVAISPKSNTAYLGINKAMEDVESMDTGDIPMHIRNAPIADMKNLGYSNGYKYPHDYENAYVEQQYLPDKMLNVKYFNPKAWEWFSEKNKDINK